MGGRDAKRLDFAGAKETPYFASFHPLKMKGCDVRADSVGTREPYFTVHGTSK
jgi:hypothetical protein